eukprot:scaffold248295_cov22-Tisochrysis_lutea.AAC.2
MQRHLTEHPIGNCPCGHLSIPSKCHIIHVLCLHYDAHTHNQKELPRSKLPASALEESLYNINEHGVGRLAATTLQQLPAVLK